MPAARSVAGDSDNSLSVRWFKLGSTGAMNHAPGAGGGRVSWQMMRNRWDATRLLAADKARASGSEEEAKRIMQFQFRDIRPKAASEIADISEASALLGHSKEGITERVYRRVVAIAKPTK